MLPFHRSRAVRSILTALSAGSFLPNSSLGHLVALVPLARRLSGSPGGRGPGRRGRRRGLSALVALRSALPLPLRGFLRLARVLALVAVHMAHRRRLMGRAAAVGETRRGH